MLPHISYERLQRLGFTEAELEKVEAALPGTFEISFAFNPWAMGADVMNRLGISEGGMAVAQFQPAPPAGLQ